MVLHYLSKTGLVSKSARQLLLATVDERLKARFCLANFSEEASKKTLVHL